VPHSSILNQFWHIMSFNFINSALNLKDVWREENSEHDCDLTVIFSPKCMNLLAFLFHQFRCFEGWAG
jgi:hypothetical protein